MAMAQLAGGSNRRLAAVVAGTWGYARLGGDATQHEAVRMNALQGSLVHSTAALKALVIARTRANRRLQGHAG